MKNMNRQIDVVWERTFVTLKDETGQIFIAQRVNPNKHLSCPECGSKNLIFNIGDEKIDNGVDYDLIWCLDCQNPFITPVSVASLFSK